MMSGGFPCICNLKKNKPAGNERHGNPNTARWGAGGSPAAGSGVGVGVGGTRAQTPPAWVAAGARAVGSATVSAPPSGWGCARAAPGEPPAPGGGAEAAAPGGSGSSSSFRPRPSLPFAETGDPRRSDTRGSGRGIPGGPLFQNFLLCVCMCHNPTPPAPAKVEGKGAGPGARRIRFPRHFCQPATPLFPRNRDTQLFPPHPPTPAKKNKNKIDE